MNHADFGDVIYEQTLEDCILKGMLCDYKLYACDWKEGLISVMEGLSHYNRKHIVLFFNRIENSMKVQQSLVDAGFAAYHLDGNTNQVDRQVILNNFRTKPSIICNVNIIGEGVNLPMIDCIVFMESRSSDIGIIQNLGRGLRTHANKDFCMVLMTDEMLENKSIIKTLRKNDSRVCNRNMCISHRPSLLYKLYGVCHLVEISDGIGQWEYKYQLCVEFEKNDKLIGTTKYKNISIGTWIDRQRQNYKKDKLTSVQIEKLQKLDSFKTLHDKWEETYKLCLKYQKTDKIIGNTKYKNVAIGRWMDKQKQNYKKDKLSKDQIEKLQKLDSFKTLDDRWEETYNLCLKYQKTDKIIGNTKYKNVLIGRWLENQKQNYKKDKLSKDQIEKLQKLDSFKTLDDIWEETYLLCLKYQKTDKIKKNTKYKNVAIGGWMSKQRHNYKKGIRLTDDRLEKLKKLKCMQDLINSESDSE
jgi:superfamily II DNA or RNA helicase